jgi:hypothetical protein
MSSSFSSRRITGNGSGASQGWGPRNGLMMATSQHRLMSDSVSKRGLQLVNIGADARNFPRTRWTSASRGMGYTPGTPSARFASVTAFVRRSRAPST